MIEGKRWSPRVFGFAQSRSSDAVELLLPNLVFLLRLNAADAKISAQMREPSQKRETNKEGDMRPKSRAMLAATVVGLIGVSYPAAAHQELAQQSAAETKPPSAARPM